jgi:outer membrane lipoprotein-sorting protein
MFAKISVRHIARTAFFAGALTIFALPSFAQGPLGEILKRMDNFNKGLSSLKSSVTMVKTNAQLGESDTSVGTTSYLPKSGKRVMYVRVDWTRPVEENIVVIGESYQLFRPKLNQVITGRTTGAKNNAAVGGALGFMSMSREQLKANYDVRYIGEETISGGTKTFHLELTPKTATSYKLADLWVNADGFPQQAKITERNNDTTTVLLTDVKTNVRTDTAIFKLNLPKNVQKVKA